jgi:hypothetical protein
MLHVRTVFLVSTFAFIKAECFGGDCDYAGFVTQNGQPLLEGGFDGAVIDNLRRSLKPLGVRLLTGNFPSRILGFHLIGNSRRASGIARYMPAVVLVPLE